MLKCHLVVVNLVERCPEVNTLANLTPAAVHEVLDPAILDCAALYLSVRHEVPEVDALGVEVLDLEVQQLQAGDGRRKTVLGALFVLSST